ncbi:LysR substrate-binding domain-containing protein [Vibrio sp. EA2]|uniref:LysR substrate-binding domain-containing protein n=1 Tax=Vibrio sp. EA2 TaxID=3079860 RepID=UPI002949F99A|nr:LysR substrate-binding domain-containing protein [Vibrio sp. EA2]MDV6249989.1 LysR substrate-binding domain-containing protein [Vibrio sp. EA2]
MLYRNNMPSLQILVVFEASARLLSFTAAAKELGTTQSAVSQQVKGLEEWLETPLFERVYRGVKLTDEGQVLFNTTQSSLKALSDVLSKIKQANKNRQIRFYTDFAFASYWLMPTLTAFRREHPHIDIRVETSQTPGDSLSQGTDIAIVFGSGHLQGKKTKMLFSEVVYPVMSPHLLREGSQQPVPEELAHLPLLKLKTEANASWITWENLLEKYDGSLVNSKSIMEFDNYTLLIQAAIAGQGIALGWEPLINSMTESGILVPLKDMTVRSDNGYYVVIPDQEPTPEVSLFMDWLEDFYPH